MERVEDWAVSQAAELLATASISPRPPQSTPRPTRGTTVTLDIPLDDNATPSDPTPPRAEAVHTVHKRREPIRRDSLKRREALLKGKEGSRQRRRWENDRLIGNPAAEPPLPEDWAAKPTHPVRRVPYFLAPLWDAEYMRRSQERTLAATKQRKAPEDEAAERVKQELRGKMKRARGARGLLQDLEEDVRDFMEKWNEKQMQLERDGLIEPDDSDDDEIVFVGRGGVTLDEKRREKQEEVLAKDKLVFQSLVDDHGAAFGRYLVHTIAEYYGLRTWSKTTGNRREAYVGLKTNPKTRQPSLGRSQMPRPLWAVV